MVEEQQILEDDQVSPASRGSLMNILLVLILVLIAGVGGVFCSKVYFRKFRTHGSIEFDADPTDSEVGTAGITGCWSDGTS